MMNDEKLHYAETRFGFEYGAATVERIASNRGTVVIGVRPRGSYKGRIEIYVSPTGRSIRAYRNGKRIA